MSALFDFRSFVAVLLLTICTCTYIKSKAPSVLSEKTGFRGLFWKFARVGERSSLARMVSSSDAQATQYAQPVDDSKPSPLAIDPPVTSKPDKPSPTTQGDSDVVQDIIQTPASSPDPLSLLPPSPFQSTTGRPPLPNGMTVQGSKASADSGADHAVAAQSAMSTGRSGVRRNVSWQDMETGQSLHMVQEYEPSVARTDTDDGRDDPFRDVKCWCSIM